MISGLILMIAVLIAGKNDERLTQNVARLPIGHPILRSRPDRNPTLWCLGSFLPCEDALPECCALLDQHTLFITKLFDAQTLNTILIVTVIWMADRSGQHRILRGKRTSPSFYSECLFLSRIVVRSAAGKWHLHGLLRLKSAHTS